MQKSSSKWVILFGIIMTGVIFISAIYKSSNNLPKLANIETEKVIKQIFDHTLSSGKCYTDLEYLCKRIGGRLSGSPQAAAAVEWALQTLERINTVNAYKQDVMVPYWERTGKEEARIISKHIGWQSVNVCALGGSVSTEKWGVTAKVIKIDSLEALDLLGTKQISGKIVYLDRPFDPTFIDTFDAYSACASNRFTGASKAAKYGAVAFVLRSLASNDDEHPHTGSMHYEDDQPKIPAAAIATEDANLLTGLMTKDPDLSLYLQLNCMKHPDRLSHNVIGEIKGSEFPNEVIVVGGHLDSWDNGEGAHDDGAGTVHSIEVLRTLVELGITPKRTIRCVLFMNEENGAKGAQEYAKLTSTNGESCIAAIESDRGGFSPRGFTIETNNETLTEERFAKLKSYRTLLEPFGIHQFEKGFSGVDVKYLKPHGTTCLGLVPDPQRYFNYHHTPNDTFDKVNERELKMGAAAMTALAYLISEEGW